MKTIVVRAPGGLERLALIDRSDPGAPGRSEVRVRVHASSLNFHDYAVVTGRIPAADDRIPMSDGAGIVEAVGADVTDFAVGDTVISCFFPLWQAGEPTVAGFASTPGDGIDGYAREIVVAPATWFTPAPSGWSFAEAATLPTAGLTAWRGLIVNGGLKAGDTVLALGTGGVSIYALQIAKSMGARVAITSSSDAKLERAHALGADHTVNYRRHADWGSRVLAWTGGRGVDHVVEVAGPGTLAQSIQACRVGGHIAQIGVLTGASGEVAIRQMMMRQIRYHCFIVGSHQHQMDMVRAMASTALRPVIDRRFALENIAAAFRHEESGAHVGKICLEF